MSARPRFRISGWLVGSFSALLVTNFFLIVFVSGTDILLGQPPQFMVPLAAALIIASTALVVIRRLNARAAEVLDASSQPSLRRPKRVPREPAYLSMTIIKRPSVYASSSVSDDWKGTVQ